MVELEQQEAGAVVVQAQSEKTVLQARIKAATVVTVLHQQLLVRL